MAATDEISGLAAPERTATPRPARPISTRGPTTMPSLIKASMIGGLPTTTSNVSPASIFCLTSGFTPKRRSILLPVERSNCAHSSRTAALGPLPLRTFSSAACAAEDAASSAGDQREQGLHDIALPGSVRLGAAEFDHLAP